MKLRNLFGLGAVVAFVAYRRKQGRHAPSVRDLGVAPGQLDDDQKEVISRSGIAQVDPEPLSHVAGEGIDLDRDVEATTRDDPGSRLP